jgi:CubicO group peptidase (beta-lactamase class C family)
MNIRIKIGLFVLLLPLIGRGQDLKWLDGSSVKVAELEKQVSTLVQKAKVTGLGISILNHNQPVYTHTFGLADAANKVPLEATQVFYGASLSKAVFAYIVMQLVQEKWSILINH